MELEEMAVEVLLKIAFEKIANCILAAPPSERERLEKDRAVLAQSIENIYFNKDRGILSILNSLAIGELGDLEEIKNIADMYDLDIDLGATDALQNILSALSAKGLLDNDETTDLVQAVYDAKTSIRTGVSKLLDEIVADRQITVVHRARAKKLVDVIKPLNEHIRFAKEQVRSVQKRC